MKHDKPFQAISVVAGTAVTFAAFATGTAGIASAAPEGCPDIQVVFARGTGEAPGVGRVGQAFVDSLQPLVGGRSVAV